MGLFGSKPSRRHVASRKVAATQSAVKKPRSPVARVRAGRLGKKAGARERRTW